MPDLSLNIRHVQAKLQQLLKQHEQLLNEHAQQKKLIAGLKETGTRQKHDLEILRQQQLVLKASLDKLDGKDKKELEQKINGYLRNIDKCISLLSHKPSA